MSLAKEQEPKQGEEGASEAPSFSPTITLPTKFPTGLPKNLPDLKHAHKTMKVALPVMASVVSLVGALVTASDVLRVEQEKEQTKKQEQKKRQPVATTGFVVPLPVMRYSVLEHAIALVTHLLIALVFLCVVGILLILAFLSPPISPAIVLSALIVLTLWLAEIKARHPSW